MSEPLQEAAKAAAAPFVTGADIVAEARLWLDTPYHHGQSTKGMGADCIGLPGGIARELRMPSGVAWARDPAVKGYGPMPQPAMLLECLSRYLVPIAIDDALPGDIYLLKWKDGEPSHFAIVSCLDPLSVIHCYASFPRRVVEHNIAAEWRDGITWRSMILSAWRFRELAD